MSGSSLIWITNSHELKIFELWWLWENKKFSDENQCFDWIKSIHWYRLVHHGWLGHIDLFDSTSYTRTQQSLLPLWATINYCRNDWEWHSIVSSEIISDLETISFVSQSVFFCGINFIVLLKVTLTHHKNVALNILVSDSGFFFHSIVSIYLSNTHNFKRICSYATPSQVFFKDFTKILGYF